MFSLKIKAKSEKISEMKLFILILQMSTSTTKMVTIFSNLKVHKLRNKILAIAFELQIFLYQNNRILFILKKTPY